MAKMICDSPPPPERGKRNQSDLFEMGLLVEPDGRVDLSTHLLFELLIGCRFGNDGSFNGGVARLALGNGLGLGGVQRIWQASRIDIGLCDEAPRKPRGGAHLVLAEGSTIHRRRRRRFHASILCTR